MSAITSRKVVKVETSNNMVEVVTYNKLVDGGNNIGRRRS